MAHPNRFRAAIEDARMRAEVQPVIVEQVIAPEHVQTRDERKRRIQVERHDARRHLP